MTTKVGIISSYKTRCGIASFTDTIESLLGSDFSIEVLPLDQFALRHKHPRVEKIGNESIEEIGRRLKDFDVINLQWEPGLIGFTGIQRLRRTRTLFEYMKAAKKPVIISAHTVVVLPPMPSNPLRTLKWIGDRGYASLTHFLLRQLDRDVDLTLVAHTPRDREYFKHVVGLTKVVDHPLSYMRDGWPTRVFDGASDYRAKLDQQVGRNKKIIGTFGFLSDYKGMEVAIRAMRSLPDDYVLFIYGEVHGENVKAWQPVNQYVSKLMGESLGDQDSVKKVLTSAPRKVDGLPNSNEAQSIQEALRQEIFVRNKSVADRVFFKGSPDDFEFALAVKAVDACVFPYLEIGQSASGPVSQAVELRTKVALSRTKAFSELEAYYPGALSFFEIGNHIQLAQLLRDLVLSEKTSPEPAFDQKSLKRFYGSLFDRSYANRAAA